MRSNTTGMRRIALGTVLTVSLSLAACGDDEQGATAGGAARRSPAGQKVTITATGSEKAPKFAVTGKARPGATTIEVRNDLTKGEVDGQLVLLGEEHTDKEVAAELGKAMQGRVVADWFEGGGGPGSAAAGKTASVLQELKAGTYVVASGEGKPKLPLARLEVGGEGGPQFKPPAAKITATEYEFSAEGVRAGSPVLLDNAGGQWHHFLASRLRPGATIQDARRYLKTEKGKPPFTDDANALESTVLDGGVSQVVDQFDKPGRYALFCFLADKQGGPPHVVKGMVSEVTVAAATG